MTQVMLIEDNIALLESIALELEMRGYSIVTAADGQQALDYLFTAEQPPDVVVSDISMPNLDGYKLLKIFREDPRWQATPFIFLTALSMPNFVRLGKELDVDDYITKPFETEDLVIAIENKLRRAAQMKRASERQLDSIRQELLAVISHELRTPLSAIFGGVEMLAENIDQMPDEVSKRMLTIVRSGAQRLNHLISQIMYLVEVDSGHMEQAIARLAHPCDLAEIIYGAVDLATKAYDYNPTVRILCDIPRAPLYVHGAQDFLVAAVLEVLRNAVNFSSDYSQVVVSLREEDEHGVISVTDHGIGIAPEDLERVWGRFVQINRDYYEQQGAGLGLALVYECARLHGGTCSINSALGQGTEVSIRLPLVPAPEN